MFTWTKEHRTQHPIEKARDMEPRVNLKIMLIMLSARREERLCAITQAEPEPRQAYLHGALQYYALYGQVGNVFNEKIFMKSGSHPSDIVRLHLG